MLAEKLHDLLLEGIRIEFGYEQCHRVILVRAIKFTDKDQPTTLIHGFSDCERDNLDAAMTNHAEQTAAALRQIIGDGNHAN